MFSIHHVIQDFNKQHDTTFKSTETWGLYYLTPDALAFLNKFQQLHEDKNRFGEAFTQRAQLQSIQHVPEQHSSQSLKNLSHLFQKLNNAHLLATRRTWEYQLRAALDKQCKQYTNVQQLRAYCATRQHLNMDSLTSLMAMWDKHRALQFYSSQELLTLLDIITIYQKHIHQALTELRHNQDGWLVYRRMPAKIAENYQYFLLEQLTHLKTLHDQVIDAALIRLSIVDQTKQVTFDDVSYLIAQHAHAAGWLPQDLWEAMARRTDWLTKTAPLLYLLQQAVNTHGNQQQRQQLNQLSWFKVSQHDHTGTVQWIRTPLGPCLMPTLLMPLVPRHCFLLKYCQYLFKHFLPHTHARWQFLIGQQALLVQTMLSLNMASVPHQHTAGFIYQLNTIIELLQGSIQQTNAAIAKHTLWWQWRCRHWYRCWQYYLADTVHQTAQATQQWIKAMEVNTHLDQSTLLGHRNAIYHGYVQIKQLSRLMPSITIQWQRLADQLHALITTTPLTSAVTAIQSFRAAFKQKLDCYQQAYLTNNKTIPAKRQQQINDFLLVLAEPQQNLPDLIAKLVAIYRRTSLISRYIPQIDGSLLRHLIRPLLFNQHSSTTPTIPLCREQQSTALHSH